MTIEIVAFLGFVFIATSLIAKAYERRQDVLYGPYIQGRDRQDPVEIALARFRASGLRQAIENVSWKARNVSCFASAIIC
jgi:hypothetical protein